MPSASFSFILDRLYLRSRLLNDEGPRIVRASLSAEDVDDFLLLPELSATVARRAAVSKRWKASGVVDLSAAGLLLTRLPGDWSKWVAGETGTGI